MGKKKGKAAVVEQGYKMITLDDVRTREVKYSHRVEALKHCMNYLDDMLLELEELNEQAQLLESWLSYLSCDGLPKPYLPPDIRLFFVKLRHFENLKIEKNIDWTLSVDDRSVLTQDIFRIDKTRETMKRENKPDFGLEYDQNINLALQVLKSIEYYLADEKQYEKAKPSILHDIMEQKSTIHREICGFLDRCTYRILTSETANLESVNAKIADYGYEGTSFQIHLWTIQNVPIRFEFLDDPFMIANLSAIGVEITIPLCILQDNLSLRGLHYNFDHFSEYAKSFDQIITIPVESLNAGIQDLRDCLANEWKMQIEIQLEVRNSLIQKRTDFEELKRQIEEEEARRAKEKKNDKDKKEKKRKDLKLPKEPSVIKDDEVPDIWVDFLEKEHKEYIDFLNTIYHPDLLKLEPHELNLKKYLILGGIYQIDFVDKPRHYDFDSFNMTWHDNDAKLRFRHEFRIESLESGRSSAVQPNSNDLDEDFDTNTTRWFVIRMDLPEHLCLWGVPMPCHFEADVIGYIEEEKEPEPLIVPTSKHKKGGHGGGGDAVAASAATPVSPAATTPRLSTGQSAVTTILRNSIANVHMLAGRKSNVLRMATDIVSEHSIPSELDLVARGVQDFELNFPLTKAEMRNLTRHCMTRIISSYKFPSEFYAEDRERSAKAKSAGGTLVRRHTLLQGSATDLAPADRSFSTRDQLNPERLFPVFQHPDELRIRNVLMDPMMYDNGNFEEPKTFFDLVKRLDNIKRYYLERPLRTSNLPAFQPNMKVVMTTTSKGQKPSRTSLRKSIRPTITGVASTTRMHRESRKTTELKKQQAAASQQVEIIAIEEKENTEDQGVESESEKDKASRKSIPVVEPIDTRKSFTFSRWTTKYIKHSEFDRQKRKLTIWTDRLGVIGLAYKRYEHLPFRFWSLEPSEEDPDNEVIFTLETQYARVVLFVTGDGVRGYVTDLEKKFVRNRPMYLIIEEPLKDFRELRRRFREKNLNIFSERDASFYIENGYFSQKHLATELHTYCCMCTHAQLMRFIHSEWNRLSSRRNLVLRLVHHRESDEYMCTVRIQPEESTFVNIKELCSDDLNVFNLEYSLTWRNIDFYADLDHLITSMFPSASDQRVKNPHLLYFLKAILWEIRPLSFS